VVFDNKIALEPFQGGFERIFEKKEWIIRVEEIYLNKSKNQALLDALVVEDGNQNFFIVVQSKENKTTVRLYPGTGPEKTKGVKRSLGIVAARLKKQNPQANIIKTNILEFID
jgi:hypothetical protein